MFRRALGIALALAFAATPGLSQPATAPPPPPRVYDGPPVIMPPDTPHPVYPPPPPFENVPVQLIDVHNLGAMFILPGSLVRSGNVVHARTLGIFRPEQPWPTLILAEEVFDCAAHTRQEVAVGVYSDTGIKLQTLAPSAPKPWTEGSTNGHVALFACGEARPLQAIVYPTPQAAYAATRTEIGAWRDVEFWAEQYLGEGVGPKGPPLVIERVQLIGAMSQGAVFIMPDGITRDGRIAHARMLSVVAPIHDEAPTMFVSDTLIDCRARTIAETRIIPYDDKGKPGRLMSPSPAERWTDNTVFGRFGQFVCSGRKPAREIILPDAVTAFAETQKNVATWQTFFPR